MIYEGLRTIDRRMPTAEQTGKLGERERGHSESLLAMITAVRRGLIAERSVLQPLLDYLILHL